MDAQRLRNLTTGKLHTEIKHIYEDLELITGGSGFMTHMLPNALNAALPWLKVVVTDQEYWDDTFSPEITGEYDLPEATQEEKEEMRSRFTKMPSPIFRKINDN